MEEKRRMHANPDRGDGAAAAGEGSLPAPRDDVESASEAGDDDAEKIDVCSDKFDPVLALYSPTVPLPFPNVRCFNNVSEYESFLRGGRGRAKPENVEKRRLKAMRGVTDPERIERLKKLMVNNPVVPEPEEGASSAAPPRRRRQRPLKNVLTRMALCKGSPLGELYRCVQERIRVKVHIRTFKGLRGLCSGFVVAFDKFWNMAMVDVDETYREPLLGEAFYHEKALTISRLFEKLKVQESSAGDEPSKTHEAQERAQEAAREHQPAQGSGKRGHSRTGQAEGSVSLKAQGPEVGPKKDTPTYGRVHRRHINQLFIRGENVVLVNPQPL